MKKIKISGLAIVLVLSILLAVSRWASKFGDKEFLGLAIFSSDGLSDPEANSLQPDRILVSTGPSEPLAEQPFAIHWPPLPPKVAERDLKPALLNGILHAHWTAEQTLTLQLELVRPSTAEERTRWNKRLAFNNIGWMNNVKVWDQQKLWLWPNLPFLLKLSGEYREQRYGGVDPAKGVDNDFAAVLIRAYDNEGLETATIDQPLVSASWYPADSQSTNNKITVVHQALSDRFTIVLNAGNAGRFADEAADSTSAISKLKVWLIFADFLNSKPPKQWPKDPEWAGGILAYFELERNSSRSTIKASSGHGDRWYIQQKIPTSATGFDWGRWVYYEKGRSTAEAKTTLTITKLLKQN